MRIIGLTGPAGAGKDEAAKLLKRRGAFIIDADKIAHALYVPQSLIWQELVRAFGSKILKRGGEINRKKLGEIVFSDKKKLQELNRIVHPYLKQAITERVESCQLSVVSCPLLVINAALLKEIGLVEYVDEVWVIMASNETRLRRLVKAGFSKERARQRMSAQASQKDYLKMADKVIKNDGTLKELAKRVRLALQNV
ncbi:dephospho-CoA kinase [Candidatus Saganbacteria bacterium]|uniref:Dephospho-CoA kinase n=1 Tax=Candidatus Saganbacteria bacterium TaxID=2575572 RepID=A0A9D6ULU7_UNCSA|nr:dephospho-CoA kinase [Candidatus Saganbacteria bacterium]